MILSQGGAIGSVCPPGETPRGLHLEPRPSHMRPDSATDGNNRPMTIQMTCAAAALAALLLASDLAQAQQSGVTAPADELNVSYSGAVLFLPVADITLAARLTEGDYSAAATFRSSGLLRWFDDTDIQANSIGYRRATGLAPYRYEHVNFASEKGRVVGIDFVDSRAVPDVNPPFSSMGEPPASDAERDGALDPISVMLGLALALPGDRATPCSGTLPVFDGKARYDLRFVNVGVDQVRTRAWQGEAVRCQAFVEPVSGYDPGDRPSEEETARPVNIWLAPIGEMFVPVRFRAATRIGDISITAESITLGATR